MALFMMVYQSTKNFPREELFGLVSQMRRAATSVPSNIAEGYGRKTKKDKVHFYYISRGSLNELEYYLDLGRDLGYLNHKEYDALIVLRADTGRLLTGLIKSLEN